MSKAKWMPIVIIVWAAPLVAQQGTRWSDPEFEGAGFAGGSFIPNQQFGTVGIHYGSGYQLGARVNENLNQYWTADLEYSFANQPVRFTNLAPGIPSLDLGQTIHHFSYSVSYIPLGGFERFRPYAKVGTGATLFYLHSDTRDDALALGVAVRDSWKFTMNFGGGFKFMVDDQTALLFDVKDYISGVPSYGLPTAAEVVNGQFQPGFAPRGLLQNIQLNFGIAYRWNN